MNPSFPQRPGSFLPAFSVGPSTRTCRRNTGPGATSAPPAPQRFHGPRRGRPCSPAWKAVCSQPGEAPRGAAPVPSRHGDALPCILPARQLSHPAPCSRCARLATPSTAPGSSCSFPGSSASAGRPQPLGASLQFPERPQLRRPPPPGSEVPLPAPHLPEFLLSPLSGVKEDLSDLRCVTGGTCWWPWPGPLLVLAHTYSSSSACGIHPGLCFPRTEPAPAPKLAADMEPGELWGASLPRLHLPQSPPSRPTPSGSLGLSVDTPQIHAEICLPGAPGRLPPHPQPSLDRTQCQRAGVPRGILHR